MGRNCCFLINCFLSLFFSESPGCSDGSREGFGDFERIAACGGRWNGHVMHASILCARGWRVCGWYDRALLSNITWEQAISFPGCFVINAAHDGGKCQECRDDLEQVGLNVRCMMKR